MIGPRDLDSNSGILLRSYHCSILIVAKYHWCIRACGMSDFPGDAFDIDYDSGDIAFDYGDFEYVPEDIVFQSMGYTF